MIKIGALLKNKVAQNAGWLIGANIIQMIVSFFVSIWSARYLGPSNYGLINYANAYIAFFMSFCTLGINSVIVKELVDHPKSEGQIIGTTIFLRGVSSLLSAIMIVAIVSLVDAGEKTTIAVVALATVGLVFNILNTFNYWFQSKLKSKVTAVVSLVAYLITSLYKIFLLVNGKSVEMFALVASVDYICLGIGLIVCYFRCNGQKISVSFKYGKQLLRKSAPFILPGLMVAIYGQTDKIMLKQMMSEAETGYYSTAMALCGVWCFVLSAIIDSFYPPIMKAYNEDEEKFNRLNKTLYAIIFYVSSFVSVMFVIFAELAIKILYGQDYMPSVVPLRIITWYTAFSYLGVARNAWIVCKNRQKKLICIYAASAIMNVILNLVLIPFMGTAGAAIASLAAQVLTTMVVPLFMKDYKENTVMLLEAISLKGIIKRKK